MLKHLFFYAIVLIVLTVGISYCSSGQNNKFQSERNGNQPYKEMEDSAVLEVVELKPLIIKYSIDTIPKDIKNFFSALKYEQKEIILALNRLSRNFIRTGTILTIPDTIFTDLLMYSPFPESITLLFPSGKLIFISQRIQAFAAYENGDLLRWGPVSSGKSSSPTPNGLYYTNFKARVKISTVNSSWIMPWYYNIENKIGIGMHEYILPGFPASHACIRLFEKDAIWIYNWAEGWLLGNSGQKILKNGTPVVIFGKYDYVSIAPWRMLVDDFRSNNLTADDLIEIQTLLGSLNK